MKRTKRLIFLAAALFFLYGCELALLGIGAGGGIAGYKYLEEHTSRDFPMEFSRAWDVTNTALENLRISVTKSKNNEINGTIKGIRKDGKEVTVKLKERNRQVTTISIRTGKFLGSREDAEKVLNEIASVAGL